MAERKTAKADITFLSVLWDVVEESNKGNRKGSYTASLTSDRQLAARKIGEEGLETALAVACGEDDEVRNEAADVLYHLMTALAARNISFSEVVDLLEARHEGPSHPTEKSVK